MMFPKSMYKKAATPCGYIEQVAMNAEEWQVMVSSGWYPHPQEARQSNDAVEVVVEPVAEEKPVQEAKPKRVAAPKRTRKPK